MRLDISEITKNYDGLIFKVVKDTLYDATTATHEELVNRIFDCLTSINLKKPLDDRAKKNLVCLVAKRRCWDYLRRRAAERRRAERSQSKVRYYPPFNLEEIKEKYNLAEIKHQNILEAYAGGLTRREIARKFRLTVQQVKVRLEYGKKKLRQEIGHEAQNLF